MSDSIDVSVVVVNYNSATLLINAVNSVFEHTRDVNYEVIVVDNASPDGSGAEIEKYFGDKIQFIQSDENIGFGRANNMGISKASGNYVFLLNPDTLVLNNALWYFLDFAKKNDNKYEIGALGSLLLDEYRKVTNSYSTFPTIKSVLNNSLKSIFSFFTKSVNSSDIKNERVVEPFFVDFISGADLFIPSMVLNRVGIFDPRYFMYCEETDLQKRMADIGLKRIIISGPKIIHYDGGTFEKKDKKSNNRRIMQDKGLLIYLEKHNSGLKYSAFKIIFLIFRFPALINPDYTFKENYLYFKYIYL